jgi:hypothetical protein
MQRVSDGHDYQKDVGSMTSRKAVAIVVVLLACVALPAFGGDKEEAKRLFEAGLNLMKMEDFPAATANFERSVSLFPTQNSLFNLANCYRATRRYGEALDTLARLQHDFGKALKPEIQAAASRQESEIRGLVVRLIVRVTPAEALVSVDGKDVGAGAERGPLVLSPGQHVVEATLSGYRPVQRTLQLVSGKEEVETIVLESVASPLPMAGLVPTPSSVTATSGTERSDLVASPASSDDAAAPPVYKRWWFWTAAAAVAVGAGIGIFAATAGGEASGPATKLGTQGVF